MAKMRIFLLFALLFMARVRGDDGADGKVCNLTEKPTVAELTEPQFSNCTVWQGQEPGTEINFFGNSGLTQKLFDQIFSIVETIRNVSGIWFHGIDTLTSMVFPKLKSLGEGEMKRIWISNCRKVENVTFGDLSNVHGNTKLDVRGMSSLTMESYQHLMETFSNNKDARPPKECFFFDNIGNVADLSNCTTMTRLAFKENTAGFVNTTITYVHLWLGIVNTRLDDLSFLKLPPREEKNEESCVITGNNFTEYNEKELREMVEGFYKSCTIANNTGKDYVCELDDITVMVNDSFIEKCGEMKVWRGQKNTELVFAEEVNQSTVDNLLAKVRKIKNVKMVFKKCPLKKLNFASLTEWYHEEGMALSVRYCNQLAELSLPKLNSSKGIKLDIFSKIPNEKSLEKIRKHTESIEITAYNECLLFNSDEVVDASFIERCGQKNVWIGQQSTTLLISKDVDQKMVNQLLVNVKLIDNVKMVVKDCKFKTMEFRELEYFYYDRNDIALSVRNCPKLKHFMLKKLRGPENGPKMEIVGNIQMTREERDELKRELPSLKYTNSKVMPSSVGKKPSKQNIGSRPVFALLFTAFFYCLM